MDNIRLRTCAFLRKIGRADAAQRLEKKERLDRHLGPYSYTTTPSEYLSSAFSWEETPEKGHYWSVAHQECARQEQKGVPWM
jgi:hypothetical protein